MFMTKKFLFASRTLSCQKMLILCSRSGSYMMMQQLMV